MVNFVVYNIDIYLQTKNMEVIKTDIDVEQAESVAQGQLEFTII